MGFVFIHVFIDLSSEYCFRDIICMVIKDVMKKNITYEDSHTFISKRQLKLSTNTA